MFRLTAILFLTTHLSIAQHPLNIIREEVRIPMRDGITLGAILYRPELNGKYPALVYRTPYGIEDYDSYAEFPLKAAKQGYLVYLVDVRGRLTSEGEFEAYRNEKSDGYDVIEWVAMQPICNGKVGTYGGSYPGIVQWQAMSQAPPHLFAAAPEMTPISSHSFIYYGGAFSHPWLDWFIPYILADKRKRANDTSGPWDDEEATEVWEKSDRRKSYQYRPLIEIPLLKKYAPEYYQWLLHPDSSAWWDFVNMENDFSKFKNPVFLLSGWYDATYGPEGATRAFNKMKTETTTGLAKGNTKLVLGPWNHTSLNTRKTTFGEISFGSSAGMDYDADLLRWFDSILKEGSTSTFPPVSIFVMGENKWRAENEWPLSRAVPTSLYFHSTGKAVLDKNDGLLNIVTPKKEPSDSYIFDPLNPLWDVAYEKSYPYDQREIESRKDVLVYTSAPLTSDLEVAGEIITELFVSSAAKDTDFSFTLCDVYPDGRSINLTGLDAGYLRMRYRKGLNKQELITPNEIYKIRIGNVYTANLFKQGHRIRVYVTSSKAPHYDPNPNTGTEIATEKNLVSTTNTLHHSYRYPSRLILPVIPLK
ncbi:MAG: CocE/NonD family hydrolase [Cyclobacteriaceae bacterium]|nr:CocE/NonD family hydrolase [Cyclobacteriaceae bacterium]